MAEIESLSLSAIKIRSCVQETAPASFLSGSFILGGISGFLFNLPRLMLGVIRCSRKQFFCWRLFHKNAPLIAGLFIILDNNPFSIRAKG